MSWARLRSRWAGSPAGPCLTGPSFAEELGIGEEDGSTAPRWGRPTGGREPQLAGHGPGVILGKEEHSHLLLDARLVPGGPGMWRVSLPTARAGPQLCAPPAFPRGPQLFSSTVSLSLILCTLFSRMKSQGDSGLPTVPQLPLFSSKIASYNYS